MAKMIAKGRIDQKVPAGALMSATIEFAGNGGCSVMYNHAPVPSKSLDCSPWEPRRPDIFSSIEEACHAIVQAAGGDSSIEEYEEKAA